MIQETSLEAWRAIQEKLSDRQKVVLWAFRSQGPMTNEEISNFLNWPINYVTPRVLELRNHTINGLPCPLIGSKGSKMGKSGKRAIIWGCV